MKSPERFFKEPLSLTQRDLLLLEFLNEMGPMELEPLAYAFWGQDCWETKLKNSRNRINRLRSNGLIEAIVLGRKILFYRTTPMGVSALKWYRPEVRRLKPTTQFSFNVNHSVLVAWNRIKLEQVLIARSWKSERRLISEDLPLQRKALMNKMKVFIPDGVYTNQFSKNVIFEMEHYPKSPAQRKIRISKLKGLLTYLPTHYQAIHIVCTSQLVAESYKTLTQGLKAQVQWIGEIFDQGELCHVLKK
ncbi:MAG: hypothetical protein IPJ71_19440 [Bdellovibrionales bacterium]|nr:hypothetical protein [Bdellovibrionales bacterium]